ncbi:hypothetical protein GQ44DRAFT_674086 [Phaeosphaeriaceae sp. PMI808]|nr:hypothetical protein GQ44DRAFT_674086 [Phaeosphaeriaceae sp. PMI808]
MSAARVSSRALKALTSTSKTTTRSLSITGPTTFSSLLTSDKPTFGRNHGIRLQASANIPVPDTTDTGKPVRLFNTSRSRKAVNDTSTIDFAFIPDFNPELSAAPSEFRVPILPFTRTNAATVADVEEPVMIPTIHTVAADGTHIHAPSAMSDVTEGGHIDFQGMASDVASKLTSTSDEGEHMTRQILSGLVEDILGPKPGHAPA